MTITSTKFIYVEVTFKHQIWKTRVYLVILSFFASLSKFFFLDISLSIIKQDSTIDIMSDYGHVIPHNKVLLSWYLVHFK